MRQGTVWGIVRQSAPLLLALVVVQLGTGQLLHAESERFAVWPVLLLLVPVVNAVGGNVASVLGARLASGLHVGLVAPRPGDAAVRTNVLTALAVALLTYVAVGLVLALLVATGALGSEVDAPRLFLLLVASGMLLVGVLVVVTVVAAVWSFRTGRDPDNTVIPIVTTLGDLTGVFALLLVVRLVSA